MKSTALVTVVAGALLMGFTSVSSAQNEPAAPKLTVTAGQAGYIALPDIRPAPERYALTGEQARQPSKIWQSTAGPRLRVGQAEVTLPAAR